MLIRLFLVFTVVPAVELALLVALGNRIGIAWTVFIVIGTGFLGAWLAKREGLSVLRQLVEGLQQGLPPANQVMEAALVVVGGLLLVTPGVFTDLTGLVLIFPWTRRWIAPRLLRYLVRRLDIRMNLGGHEVGRDEEVLGRPGPATRGGGHDTQGPFEHPVR